MEGVREHVENGHFLGLHRVARLMLPLAGSASDQHAYVLSDNRPWGFLGGRPQQIRVFGSDGMLQFTTNTFAAERGGDGQRELFHCFNQDAMHLDEEKLGILALRIDDMRTALEALLRGPSVLQEQTDVGEWVIRVPTAPRVGGSTYGLSLREYHRYPIHTVGTDDSNVEMRYIYVASQGFTVNREGMEIKATGRIAVFPYVSVPDKNTPWFPDFERGQIFRFRTNSGIGSHNVVSVLSSVATGALPNLAAFAGLLRNTERVMRETGIVRHSGAPKLKA